MITAKECLETAEVCLALARNIKELDKRAALLEFAYDFRSVAKVLEREERKLMASPLRSSWRMHLPVSASTSSPQKDTSCPLRS